MKVMRALKITVALIMIAGAAYAQDASSVIELKGKIIKTMGDVQVKRAGEIAWQKAEHGMELGLRDVIKTGIDSTADILINKDAARSKIRILEEADMSFATLNLDKVTGESEILLDLVIGHIIIKTDPLKGKSKFEVLTPTSLTAVRGTAFEVKVVRQAEGPAGDNGGIVQ
jgi:hypothetical protein